MKKRMQWIGLLFLLVCGGCLNTFYPIFTANDLVTETNILGTWEHNSEKMIIEKASPDEILPAGIQHFADKMLIIRDFNDNGAEKSRDLAFLVKIGDHYFLDRFPDYTNPEKNLEPLFKSLFIHQHIIYKVDSFQTGKSIGLQRVSDKRIKEQIEKKEIRIKMLNREDGNMILATTEELQSHIRKYASDPMFYENDNSRIYQRVQ